MFQINLIASLALTIFITSCAAPQAPTPVTGTAPVPAATTGAEPILNLDDFVLIKGGSFIMGDIYGSDTSAKPPHKVTVDDFYLAKYEVTFEEYDRFCTDTGRVLPDDNGWGRGNRPAINITQEDAVAYTQWLSKKTGKKIRLPSEAEWEYAARGGKSTNYWWGNDIGNNNANCLTCGSEWDNKMTAPGGSFKPNPYGLYDMQGNVYEWVLDKFHPNYDGAPTDATPWISNDTETYISRGGSFREMPKSLYASARNWSLSKEPNDDTGFRLAMEP